MTRDMGYERSLLMRPWRARGGEFGRGACLSVPKCLVTTQRPWVSGGSADLFGLGLLRGSNVDYYVRVGVEHRFYFVSRYLLDLLWTAHPVPRSLDRYMTRHGLYIALGAAALRGLGSPPHGAAASTPTARGSKLRASLHAAARGRCLLASERPMKALGGV